MINYLQQKSVLFLEDNIEFATTTIKLLELFVQQIIHVQDIKTAEEHFVNDDIDFIITDLRIKGDNGLLFVETVRKTNKEIPIVVLSGHKDEEFLFQAIPLNITTYLLKPIIYDEFKKSLEKVAQLLVNDSSKLIDLNNTWYFNSEEKVLTKDHKNHNLNKKEIQFIELMVANQKQIITRDMLLESLWDYDGTDAAITNFILRIRKRFGKDFIKTIPSVGYKII